MLSHDQRFNSLPSSGSNTYPNGSLLNGTVLESLKWHLEHLWVAECSGAARRVDNTTSITTNSRRSYSAQEVELSIHVYQLQSESPIEEFNHVDNGYSDESILMAHHWTLPSQELEGVWDT
ncbi:hypothetical protein BGZ73_007590 [Actinomortierella ambigua]|nr:hypothetical protein BGZ73_007590 [Actinomortierella ambigua]